MQVWRHIFSNRDRGCERKVVKKIKTYDGFFNRREVEKEVVELQTVPTMDRVRQFVDKIGIDNVISITEYSQAYFRIGDDRKVNIVVFYKAEKPVEFKYVYPEDH